MSTKHLAKARASSATAVARDPRQPLTGRCNTPRPDGTYCHRRTLKNKKRCAKHGGRQGTGPENSNWRGGKTQAWIRKHLPAHMMKTFDAIVNDPDLISMRAMMAVNGVRFSELLAKLPTGESRQMIRELRGLIIMQQSSVVALRSAPGLTEPSLKRLDDMTTHLDDALILLDTAAQTSQVWDEATAVMEQHRKLADTERRREEALQQSITMPQAIAMFNNLFTLINKVVRSAEERSALADGLRQMLEHHSEEAEIVL